MSADDTPQSWKLTLPCTRAEAEAIDADMEVLAMLDTPPVLMTREAEPDDPEHWLLEAYFEEKPDKETIAAIRALVPSAGRKKPVIELLPDEDWVSLSQQGLDPITAGRFHVRNRADDPVPPGYKHFLIEAGRAFGTGHHETTAGCLTMLDRCRAIGERFGNIADIGTGTGLLAFAAMHLWPRAHAVASDIDPVAIEVTEANAGTNGIALGYGRGRLSLAVAAGANHPLITGHAPYDLLIANILAGPLIELAPALCSVVAEGGTIILAGLLNEQADRVIAAYRAQGMRLADRIDGLGDGHWPVLRLRKRPLPEWRRPRHVAIHLRGEAPGFGSI